MTIEDLSKSIEQVHEVVRRGLWVFFTCTVAIIAVLLWYGNKLERTDDLQFRMHNGNRVEANMRAMFHEIHTRGTAIENRGHLCDADASELRAIMRAADTAMRLRSFYVLPDDGGEP